MKQLYPYLLFVLFIQSTPIHSQKFIKEFESFEEFVTLNDYTFFVAQDSEHGNELWKTDGTQKGTFLVKDIYEGVLGSDPKNLFSFKGNIYFTANNGITGHELYRSDGTPEGTILIKDIHSSHRIGSNPSDFTIYNDLLYFRATNNYINGSYKLFSTDGTSEGTKLVYESDSNLASLVVANDKLYFRGTIGDGLYEFDSNTNSVTSIDVDEYYTIDELNSFNNELYFITNTSYRQEIRFYHINKAGEIILLKDFAQAQYGDIDIHNFTQVGNQVFFSMTIDNGSSQYSNELWKTDGSPEGTVKIKTYGWDRHYSGSGISNFTSFNDKLFFNGGSKNNFNLLQSDGTSEGTIPVFQNQIIPVDVDSRFVKANGLLFFSSGLTIWSTDGTIQNTKQQANLSLTRNTTAENYYIKSDGKKVYFKVRDENRISTYGHGILLYTTEASPLLVAKRNGQTINNGSQIDFVSKIDSLINVRIRLNNQGRKPLLFSKIQVTGGDFYLKGKDLNEGTMQQDYFPQQIDPAESAFFDLSFYPSSSGFEDGILTIYSNDTKNPEFSINLYSYIEEVLSANNSGLVSLKKEIQFRPDSIRLTSNKLSENLPLNSPVGTLSIPNDTDEYEYSFINGEGDEDNASFQIEDNLLKSAEIFDATYKNTLSIRIRAISKSTGNVLDESIILNVEAEPEKPSLQPCSVAVEKLIFGLQDVTFISSSEVVAVGSQGVILKSYDGGQTWDQKFHKPNTRIFQLQFTDAKTGYCSGDKFLLKTEDGGENWSQLKAPDQSYPYANNLLFINAEVGFILGNDSPLYKTTDGGQNWRIIKNVSQYNSTGFFTNESTGFICGNQPNSILKTTDAGETWQSIPLNLPDSYSRKFVDVSFTDEQTGYLLDSEGNVVKTVDGGATWDLLSAGVKGWTYNIQFTSNNTGYITTASGLYKTEDAGESWIKTYSNYLLQPQAFAISEDGQHAVMVGPGTYGDSNGIAYKSATDDWKIISQFPTESSYPAIGFFGKLGFYFSENEARRTLDGGITWEFINQPDDYGFTKIGMIGENLFLLGAQNFYKSTDLGETWMIMGSLQHNSEMHLIDDQTIVAGGEKIARSIDGGESWQTVSNEEFFNVTDFSFIDNLRGAAAGLGGIVLTQDGGQSWEKISIPLEDGYSFMYSIHFFDANIGLSGSKNGVIYKTVDGGRTWSKIYTVISGQIEFLHAKSNLEWYAVDRAGSSSYLYKSTDGGENWLMIASFGSDMIRSHVDQDDFYFSGDRAELYKVYLADDPPGPPGKIEGEKLVEEGATTSYSVFQEVGENYLWEVTGDQELYFSENTAKITWHKAGNYTLSVTPYSGCMSGITKQIEIIVQKKDRTEPVISGDFEVEEFSSNNSYSVELRQDSKYQWFAEGAVGLTQDNNRVSIDWGNKGKGKVQVVETALTSGIRYSAMVNIAITESIVVKIKPTNVSCRGKNNGSLFIETSNNEVNFTAVLSKDNEVKNFNFSSQLNIENLGAGSYTLCLIRDIDNSQSCYEFEIKEPANFEVQSKTSKVSINQLDLTILGGVKPYRVFINGKQIANTNQEQFSINTTPGDFLEVFSSGDCAFSYKEIIYPTSNLAVYPNPTKGPINIVMDKTMASQKSVLIRIYSSAGNLISTSIEEINDGRIYLDMHQEATGIYFLKIGDIETRTIKIVKQ